MCELDCDETRSEDDQSLRKRRQAHDGVRGVERDAGLADRGGNGRVAPGGYDDLVGGDLLAGAWPCVHPRVDPKPPGTSEGGAAEEHRRVQAVDAVVPAPCGDRVDPAEDPVPDVWPAHPVQRGVDAVSARVGDGVGDLGGVDVHLGGDAPDVQAGTPEGPGLDDRDALAAEVGGDQGVTRAGANDCQIEVSHTQRLTVGSGSLGHRCVC